MCFGSKPQAPPPPPPLAPAPPAPPKPEAPAAAPAPLQNAGEQPTLKSNRSKRDQQGALSKGASQLRIPLNTGSSSGGFNL
jgi:hypothetical protein